MLYKTVKKAEDSSQLLLSLKDLFLWRNIRITLITFTSILLLLLDIMVHSVISVLSMAGITILLAAIGHRLLMQLWKAWKKDINHKQITRLYPNVKVELSREEATKLAEMTVFHINSILNRMIGLFLVEKWEDTFKLLVLLCGINLLGDCFNGLTLLTFGHISIFTLPKLYEWYKPMIDAQVRKFRKNKLQEKNEQKSITEKPQFEEYPSKENDEIQESNNSNILYNVCNNERLLDLLEAEHRKGCRCRDCEHQDLPIEAH
ncbi:reticulon-1-A [Drosophila eugracilis]|uniref:reticulon-1-A n=1 Tax=Drosophila eugracilis TaxID=29029 RepID=UPI0007E6C800|nr:reticulon-1-A [Drosophila eugracilis]